MYKVLIRPLEVNDAHFSWRWRNNPIVWEFTGNSPYDEISFEVEKEWIESVINDKKSKRFAILADDVYVGNIQLTNIHESEFAEYHIFIGNPNYWNKGIAKLATYQIIRYAKKVLNLKNIFLYVNPNHVQAINLYRKCGFVIVSNEIRMELDLERSSKPIVSVFVMVYNHEKYLYDAIEGILFQKCNFDFEIVVGEDFSNDNSRNILIQYQEKYPGKFKLLLHNKNIGAVQNQELVLKNCNGKYISFCEGDDFWTDSYKLQKQIDFLESNEDFILCYHNTKILNNGFLEDDYFIHKKIPQISYYHDLLCFGNYIQTSSVVFVNNINLLPFEKLSNLNDYILWFWISKFGKIYRFDEYMSVYRLGIGIWSTLDSHKQIIHTINNLQEAMKIVKNESDIIILDNRIKSLSLSLLPIELQKNYNTHYDLKEFLSRNVNISVLLISAFNKVFNKLFRFK
jgi:RimJ/RimL family protein N-acetyltransferase/glycosyltransferase involved in cell wall biosynthesis